MATMWDDIKIENEGDLQHYMNNALGAIAMDAYSLGMRADKAKDRVLSDMSERLKASVDHLNLVRDELIKTFFSK